MRPHQLRALAQHTAVRCAILSLGAVLMFASIIHEMQPSDARSAATPAEVVVQEGDTLWAIAASYGPPNADTRMTIAEIRRLNDLAGSLIRPGQVLLVPRGSSEQRAATS